MPDKGWISVKNRLPDNDGLYIVCKTVGGHQICFEAHWKENEWLSVVKNNQLDYITHWQPLPEPPKEMCNWVDAEQVKHAQWIKCCNLMGEYYKCSECGYKADVPTCMGEPIFTYCPICGSKMDGNTNNET